MNWLYIDKLLQVARRRPLSDKSAGSSFEKRNRCPEGEPVGRDSLNPNSLVNTYGNKFLGGTALPFAATRISYSIIILLILKLSIKLKYNFTFIVYNSVHISI